MKRIRRNIHNIESFEIKKKKKKKKCLSCFDNKRYILEDRKISFAYGQKRKKKR